MRPGGQFSEELINHAENGCSCAQLWNAGAARNEKRGAGDLRGGSEVVGRGCFLFRLSYATL